MRRGAGTAFTNSDFAKRIEIAFNLNRRGLRGMNRLMQGIKLLLFDSAEPGEKLRLPLLVFFFRDVFEFELHLQLQQMRFDHALIVEFALGNLLALLQYEFKTVDREKKEVIYQNHAYSPTASPRSSFSRMWTKL